MPTLRDLTVPVLAALAGAAVGYFATPTKVVTKTEIKEVIKEVDKRTEEAKQDRKNDKIYVKVETILPDGTRKIETRIVDKGTITIDSASQDTKTTDTTIDSKTEKTVEHSHESLVIYGLAGVKLNDFASGPELGAGVQKRVLGPFWLGAFGTNKLSGGVTLGISF